MADAGHDLIIVGAGGLAREVLALVDAAGGPRVVGLVDDAAAVQGTEVGGYRVLGGVDVLAQYPDARIVLCTGSPRNNTSRAKLVARIGGATQRYATLVHPSATLARSTGIGVGSILLAGVVTTADVTIGAHVVVMPAVVMTHDDVLADFVTVAAGVQLAGGVRIDTGAYVGTGTTVRENVTIGAGAVLGMGSVVLADVPAGEVWAGVPARRIR